MVNLSKEQQDQYPFYVRKWSEIATCTLPANREEAEKGIYTFYKDLGVNSPPKIIWCDSPKSAAIERAKYYYPKKSQLEERTKCLHSASSDFMYGQHNASWLLGFDFSENVFGLSKESKKIRGFIQHAQHAGWALAQEDTIFQCERHNTFLQDNEKRIHCSSGPAIQFPDNYSIYAWHGVKIPKDFIEEKEGISAEKISGENNTELRRILFEIIGWEKGISLFNPKVIHRDTSLGLKRELLEIKVKGETYRAIVMENGTMEHGVRRKFFEGVPSNISTCHDAIAWQYSIPAIGFKEKVRT